MDEFKLVNMQVSTGTLSSIAWYLLRDTLHLCRSFSNFFSEVSLKFMLFAESDRESSPFDEPNSVNIYNYYESATCTYMYVCIMEL